MPLDVQIINGFAGHENWSHPIFVMTHKTKLIVGIHVMYAEAITTTINVEYLKSHQLVL